MKKLALILVAVGALLMIGPGFIYELLGFNTGLLGLLTIFLGVILLKLSKRIDERGTTRSSKY